MRSREWVNRKPPREQMFFRARDLSPELHTGRLLTVTSAPITKSRGHLVRVRWWSPDDLTGSPGDVVIYMRARRGHRATQPEWKCVVPPDAPVLVHSLSDLPKEESDERHGDR